MMDQATGWFEILKPQISWPHNTWLVQYSHPQFIIFNNGIKFKLELKQMCNNYGIIAKLTASHIPKANSIIE
jgi:hypothetical protein